MYGQLYESYKINYGTDDGLPSSECYEIIQDSKGYIWFGTDRGVVKYNGYEFKTYTTKDGLNNNVVFNLCEDPNGKVWFYDKTHQLSYFEDNKIHSYQHNSVIKQHITDISVPLGFYVDKNETCYFSLVQHPGFIHAHDSIKKLASINSQGDVYYVDMNGFNYNFQQIDDEIVVSIAGIGKNSIDSLSVVFNKHNYSVSGRFLSNLQKYFPAITKFKLSHNQSIVYFSSSNKLYQLDDRGRIKLLEVFNKGIIELEVDKEDNIYVGLFDEGLWFIPNGNFDKKYKIISDCSASGFLKDNKGGLWVSTLDDGIYYIPSLAFSLYKPSQNVFVNHIKGNKNTIIYSTKAGVLYNLCKNEPLSLYYDKPHYTRSIFALPNDKYLVPLGSTYSYLYSNLKQKPQLINDLNSVDWAANDTALFGSNRGILFQADKSDLTNIEFLDTCIVNNTSISLSFDNKLLLGSNYGIYEYDGVSISKAFTEDSIYYSRITDIELFQQKFLITTSRGNGLIVHQKDSTPYTITRQDGLISDELDQVYSYRSHVFVLSKEGMSILQYDNNNFSITNYTQKNGLLSNEVNDVYERDDTVWVATNKGITRINLLYEVHQNMDLPVYLKNITVNRKTISYDSIVSLKYFENELTFNFEAISFKSQGKINYKYKLDGLDSDWNYTSSRTIRYPQLSPGNYVLLISYEHSLGKWSKPYELIRLEIGNPFWKEIWFYILCFLLFSGSVWLIIHYYLRKMKKEIATKQTINELERRAIQAQMNPHFIFNALTSIQSLIIQKENAKAEQFLVTFSRLVRTVLNHSSLSFVALKEEIELIDNYLKLEALRFSSKFEFTIDIDANIVVDDIEVPPMVIQPFIENAIEHGILKKEKVGKISVFLQMVNSSLIECIIEDNGIGRENASLTPKRKGRTSKGINLVKDRLFMLDKKSDIKIIDLYDGVNPIGTKVTLLIPYKTIT